MRVTQESTGDLVAKININVEAKDYQKGYNNKLKEHQKQATLPGFRPGKVPAAVVKKKHGRAILAEEINAVIGKALNDYINENKLRVLGNPLAIPSENDGGDWENPTEFNFSFEVGLAPEFDVKFKKTDKHEFHMIKVDDEMLKTQIGEARRRYGKLSEPAEADENDLLIGDLVELDDKGVIVEGGIMSSSSVSLEFMEDQKTKKGLVGTKAGDVIKVNIDSISNDDADKAKMLGKKAEEVKDLKGDFNLNVKEIKRLEPADMDQDFFDKVFGAGNIKTEEEFNAKMTEQLQGGFKADSDALFKKNFSKNIVDKLKLDLPDDFLKRWIASSNEKPISKEQLEVEYPQYAEQLKWQLVENKIIEENEIKVSQEELVNHTKEMLAQQFAQYGIPIEDENQLDTTAQNVLNDQKEAQRINDALYNEKVLNFIKDNVKLKEVEVSYKKFVELFSK
jgi:trigger factor